METEKQILYYKRLQNLQSRLLFSYNKIHLLSTGFETTLRYLDQSSQLCCLVATKCGFGGLEVSVLASDTRVRRFKPGRSRRIFRAKKSSARLPSEGK